MKNGDFPWLCESLPDGISKTKFYTDIEKTPFPYISYFSWRNKNNEFFARLILQKWSIAMEVSMRHIAKTGGCSMAIFDFSERGGFHCISLIFLDVYILIYIYLYIYIFIYIYCIYLSLIYWFTVYTYIFCIILASECRATTSLPQRKTFWHWAPPSPSASASSASTSGMKYDSLGIFVHYWVWLYMAI
jgi:hypothetical protein